jgi:transcriptional regulator with XRE-family HTH domain
MAQEQLSPRVRKAVTQLGRDIQTARRKRRLSQGDLAAKMGVSVGSVQRLERGEPGVSIGTLAMAFLALGSLHRFQEVLDPASDDIGMLRDQDHLPQRIRKKRSTKSSLTGEPVSKLSGMDL